MDPILGRDEEIRQIIDVLMRRRQNNPILTGEAGVGKTAVVEGFAQRVAAGDVPPPLRGVKAVRARYRPDAGRRLDEGRVRAAAALGDRRGADLADADHPVHRRGAHADRRRRRGRHRRCRQPAQAGAGARHAAHDRRDHLVGIPAVFREGPGADPPLPADPGRRAGRRALLRHAARHPRADGEAPQRAHLRRGDRRGGQAVAPLHSGAPAARQGGEPARYRLRARRDQPVRDAGGDRGYASRASRRARRRRRRSPRERDLGTADERAHRRDRRRDRRRCRRSSRASKTEWATEQRHRRRDPQPARKPAGEKTGGTSREPPKAEPRATARRATSRSDEPSQLREKFDALEAHRSREAHDLRACRRAGGRLGGLGLDRHSGRPHGEGRGGDHPRASPTSSTAASSASRTACR